MIPLVGRVKKPSYTTMQYWTIVIDLWALYVALRLYYFAPLHH
jgi:hypothetical protein